MHKIIRFMTVFFTLSFVFILATGCGHKTIRHGMEINEEQAKKIIDYKTTKEEILIDFGDPSKIMNDGKVFFYTWTRGSERHFFGLGSSNIYTYSLVIIFNYKGVVKSHKITRGTTGSKTATGD